MRNLPSVEAQRKVLAAWFIKFGGWRPSEAAFSVSGWSGGKRRRFFRRLHRLGCIAIGVNGWEAVKDITKACPSSEALACYVDETLTRAERRRVDEHLATCSTCAQVVEGTTQTIAEIGKGEAWKG